LLGFASKIKEFWLMPFTTDNKKRLENILETFSSPCAGYVRTSDEREFGFRTNCAQSCRARNGSNAARRETELTEL